MELPFFTSSSGATSRAEAHRWLAIAEKLLAGRDLVGSKSFAVRAREADPNLVYADQILAVADTLIAGDKRINNQHDWYSILQLGGQLVRDSELIASQYQQLALLLNPQKNKFPYADHAFTLVMNAWSVLSNPNRKNLYDNELISHLGVNSLSPGFNPMAREQVNFHQPFEFNFQVMPPPPQPQHHGMVREQVIHQPIPQHAMSREQVIQPIPHNAMSREQVTHYQMPPPQHNVIREQLSQLPPQPNLTREQVRQQPMPMPMARQQPHSQPMPPRPQAHPQQVQQQPQLQPQAAPQPQQQRKEYWMGTNVTVTHNFTGVVENSNANSNNTATTNNIGVSGNTSNNVTENVENSDMREEERRMDEEEAPDDDGEMSFWTACPYCYYMFEYPNVYAECALKCQNCKKAFQAVVIPAPPPIIDGKEAYFCCWGLMPLGVSMNTLEKNKGMGGNWTPFSPMFNCPQGFGKSGDGNLSNFRKNFGPRVYVDDEDVFVEISDSGEESDDDWRRGGASNKKKKTTKGAKRKASVTPNRNTRKSQVDKGKNVKVGGTQNPEVPQDGVEVPNAPVAAESSKKGAAPNTRRQSAARVAKDFGKLDLNVEFSNEAEEPVRRVNQANGAARGEEDIIEGSGFFEGLDEFLSSLPILNVVGDDKVKAA